MLLDGSVFLSTHRLNVIIHPAFGHLELFILFNKLVSLILQMPLLLLLLFLNLLRLLLGKLLFLESYCVIFHSLLLFRLIFEHLL